MLNYSPPEPSKAHERPDESKAAENVSIPKSRM